jgi:hypothetical protein
LFFQNFEKKPNTPNGHLEYVKYDSCLQSKIFFKKKNDKNYSNGHYHLKRGRDICFFCRLLSANSRKKLMLLPLFAWELPF